MRGCEHHGKYRFFVAGNSPPLRDGEIYRADIEIERIEREQTKRIQRVIWKRILPKLFKSFSTIREVLKLTFRRLLLKGLLSHIGAMDSLSPE